MKKRGKKLKLSKPSSQSKTETVGLDIDGPIPKTHSRVKEKHIEKPRVWVPDYLKKEIEEEYRRPQNTADYIDFSTNKRIWSDLDFPKRNLNPFIPSVTPGLVTTDEKMRDLLSFEKTFKGKKGDERSKPILESMGMTLEHLEPYPCLDERDPFFNKKFDMVKYMTDARYAIESFMKIDTKDDGVQPFKLNPVQVAFLFNRTGRDVVLKGRQHGLTTLLLAYYLWDTMLNPAVKTVILTHEKSASEGLLAKVKLMYDSIPSFLKPRLKKDSKGEMEFEGMKGSSIIIQVIDKTSSEGKDRDKSGGTGRSKKINNLLLSEPAFYKGVEDKDLVGLIECVPNGPGGSVTLESTPNGVGGFFFKEVEAAKRENTLYKLFVLPWTLNPHYDDEWKARQQRKRHFDPETEDGKRLWAQEYDCDFTQSQSNYFPSKICDPMSKWQTRIKTISINGRVHTYEPHIHIFQEPNPGELYVMGVDAAQGLDHGDYSSATVLSRKSRCEVAQIYGKFPNEKFTDLVRWLGRKYNQAFIGVENEGNGMVVLNGLLRDRDYNGDYVDPYDNLFFYFNEYAANQSPSGTPGWSTNRKTRPVMLSELKRAVEEQATLLAFRERALEMKMFTIIDGKPQAPDKENDDLIMSAAIANRLLDFPEAITRFDGDDLTVRTY